MQTKTKRKPLLIDEMLALQDKHIPKDWQPNLKFVQQRLKQAKVFAFDEQAVVYAAQMMVAHPEAIAKDIEFALPPFERMYIEFPYPKFFDITSPPDYRGYSNVPPEDDDMDIGYLYDGPNVYVMSRSTRWSEFKYPMVLPIRYRLNRTFSFAEEQNIASYLGESRLGIDSFMWGSCYRKLFDKDDKASMRALRDNHSCEFWYGQELTNQWAATALKSSAGDMRNILGLILFLNRTRDVQLVDELPPAPGWVRSKPRTLTRYNLIRIKLDPGPLLQRIFKGRATGGWRREHDVRGHFCHDATYHAHQHHDMREISVHQWKCVLCGGLKWWRKAHHRGRGDLGQVKTTYEVAK